MTYCIRKSGIRLQIFETFIRLKALLENLIFDLDKTKISIRGIPNVNENLEFSQKQLFLRLRHISTFNFKQALHLYYL